MGRRTTGTVEPLRASIRLKFTHLGKRRLETLELAPTPANIKAAERLLNRVVTAIAAGAYRREDFFASDGPKSTEPFGDYADRWLTTIVVEKSTRRSYKVALESTWKPAFIGKAMPDIRFSDIKTAVADRVRRDGDAPRQSARGRTYNTPARPVSGKTMNNYLIVLRAIFDTAVEDRLLATNPVEKVKNLKHQAASPDPFTRDEEDLILGRMERHYDAQVWNYYDLAFSTGLRPSEQIILRWPDIDWNRKSARVERAMVESQEKGTKTNQVRDIDLSDRAIAILKRQKAFTFMRDPLGEIFNNPRTNAAWPNPQIQREDFFIPTLRALGIRHRDAYQTRHTFATRLLMGGVNPAYIAKQLGHANTGMLFKVYARWIEGADKGAEAAKANKLLGPDPAPALDEVG